MGRVYESNGPDVKVRGTAQHVADKYMQLARDAQSSGDTVMAESYYQYAEHYLRLLAAAQGYLNQGSPQHQQRRPGDDSGYDDGDEASGDEQQQGGPPAAMPDSSSNGEAQPQPATAYPDDDGDGSEQPWGGPEPEFLRRSAPNGSGRARRSRSGNGRAQSSSPDNTVESDPAGEDTPEQAS